ncbi:hypothetical protein PAMP_006091 [Pampus punctatissimus]
MTGPAAKYFAAPKESPSVGHITRASPEPPAATASLPLAKRTGCWHVVALKGMLSGTQISRQTGNLPIAFSQHSNFMDLVQFFVTFFR